MKKYLSIVLMIATVFWLNGNAQKMMMFGGEGSEPLIIEEIGTIVVEQENKLMVMAVLPHSPSGKEVQETDIKKNDEILMINGKRVKSIDELKKIYEITKVDEKVKLGLERDSKMFLASFKKYKIDSNGRKSMVMTMDPGSAKNMKPWLEAGFMLGEDEGKVKVVELMPGMPDQIKLDGVKKGNFIVELNKIKIKTVTQFFEIFEAVKIGDTIEIVVLQNGKKNKISFEKPEMKGQIMIQK